MKKVQVITDPEALKAISDPLRLRILHILQREGEASATAIAEELNDSPSKISYHLKVLEKSGILVLKDTVVKGNLVEKLYAPVAKQIEISLPKENVGDPNNEIMGLLKEINTMITEDLLSLVHGGDSMQKSTISYETYYLTPEEIEAIRNKVIEELEKLPRQRSAARDGAVKCKIGFLLLCTNDKEIN